MGFWSRWWPFAKTERPRTPAVLDVMRSVHGALDNAGIAHALIGGLTFSALGIPRATKDVDFLVDAADSEHVARLMEGLGYTALEPNETFRSFVFDVYMRVDFLLARRDRTRAMLHDAVAVSFEGGRVRVLRPEDSIGLKLQASSESNPQPLVDHVEQSRDVILSSEDGFRIAGELWLLAYALNPKGLEVSREPIAACDFLL